MGLKIFVCFLDPPKYGKTEKSDILKIIILNNKHYIDIYTHIYIYIIWATKNY